MPNLWFCHSTRWALIPIDVKSLGNAKAKSLKIYMDIYKPVYAIKLSSKNFGFEGNKKIVPLYAVFAFECCVEALTFGNLLFHFRILRCV